MRQGGIHSSLVARILLNVESELKAESLCAYVQAFSALEGTLVLPPGASGPSVLLC